MTFIFNTRPAMVMNHARAKNLAQRLGDAIVTSGNSRIDGRKNGRGRFLPRYAVLVRYTLSSCVCPSVRLSVRPSQAGIVSKRLERSSCFGRGVFRPPIPHCVIRKFGHLQKFVPNSGLGKFRSRCQEKSSTSQFA